MPDKAKGKDHTEWCWYCGKQTMFPLEGYFECSECGATYCPMPTLLGPGKGVQLYDSPRPYEL